MITSPQTSSLRIHHQISQNKQVEYRTESIKIHRRSSRKYLSDDVNKKLVEKKSEEAIESS